MGPKPCIFQAHLSRLGPLAKLLEAPSRKSPASITLPNESADTFNALMHWIYNGPLPYAAKITTDDDVDSNPESESDSGLHSDSDSDAPQMFPFVPISGASMPSRLGWEGFPPSPSFSLSTSTVIDDSKSPGGTKQQHTSGPATATPVVKKARHIKKQQQRKQKEKEAAQEKKKEKEKEKQELLSEAQATQCLLLDLAMFAERHVWETLYNAAIDAFRAGEANLGRERPSPLHVEVVYRRTRPGSAVRLFIADYVYARAREHGDLVWYEKEGVFGRLPGLLEDVLVRVDGRGPFGYPWRRGVGGGVGEDVGVLEGEAPLDLDATTYHVHGGRMVLDCVRAEDGTCGVVGDVV